MTGASLPPPRHLLALQARISSARLSGYLSATNRLSLAMSGGALGVLVFVRRAIINPRVPVTVDANGDLRN